MERVKSLLNKIKLLNCKTLIAEFVSLFVFLVSASIVSSFIDEAYMAFTFFVSGILHNKLSSKLKNLILLKL